MNVELDTSILSAAITGARLGFSVIPVFSALHSEVEKRKKPATPWKQYQERIASSDEINKLFRNGNQIALVGGSVSRHLECIDFDKPDLFQIFLDTLEGVNTELRRRLAVWQETPSAGFHLLYRCASAVGGNLKLAMSKRYQDEQGKPRQDVYIETRGQGGYFLVCPSRGYTLHGTLEEIPIISPNERELLLNLARSFDEGWQQRHQELARAELAAGDRPGDIFNRDHDWSNLLESDGWIYVKTTGDHQHWTRPGKSDGSTSATLNNQGLFVFSSSTPLPVQKPLDKFAFYTYCRFGGDFTAAAQSLKKFRTVPDDSGHFRTPPDTFRTESGQTPDTSRTIAGDVLSFVEMEPAPFTNNDVYSELCIRDRRGRKTVCDALIYYEKQGKIKKIEGKRGHWEVVESKPEVMDLLSVDTDPFNILLPLEISDYVRIRPGSIILVSGSNNAGKTVFLLATVRNFFASHTYTHTALPLSNKLERKGLPPLVYLNSEMSVGELACRIKGFGDAPSSWVPHVKFIERTHSFDKLVDPDGVTFVDYLEVNEDFFQAGKFLADIHRRLQKGLSVVAMQKKQGHAFAKGGEMTLEKPRLAINLDKNEPHGFICKIVKAKEPVDFMRSIQGMERDFVITGKSEILPTSDWRFLNDIQRRKINDEYTRSGLPNRVKRDGIHYKAV